MASFASTSFTFSTMAFVLLPNCGAEATMPRIFTAASGVRQQSLSVMFCFEQPGTAHRASLSRHFQRAQGRPLCPQGNTRVFFHCTVRSLTSHFVVFLGVSMQLETALKKRSVRCRLAASNNNALRPCAPLTPLRIKMSSWSSTLLSVSSSSSLFISDAFSQILLFRFGFFSALFQMDLIL